MDADEEIGCRSLKSYHGARSRLLGTFLASMLGGLILCQTWHYYRLNKQRKGRDRWMRWFVGVLVLLVVGHTLLDQAIVFQADLGDAANVCRAVKLQLLLALFLGGLIATLCQVWLLHRVWVVSERNLLATAMGGLLWFATVTLSLTAFIIFYVRAHTPWVRQSITLWIPLVSFFSAATETYSAAAFVAFAWTRRKSVHDVRLGQMLESLAALTLQACWLPALSCLLTALILVLDPNSELYLVPLACTPSLYCTSVLFTLNSRDIIQDKAEKAGGLYTMPSIPNLNYSDTAVFASAEPITPSNSEFSSVGHSTSKPRCPDRVGVRSIDFVVEVEQRIDRTESIEEMNIGQLDPRLYHDWREPK